VIPAESASVSDVIENGDERRPLKLHILRVVPTLVILGLLVYFLLPRLGTIESSIQTLRDLRPIALVIALIWEILSYVANGALLQSVIQLAGDKAPLRRTMAIEIGAGTVSLVAAGALGFGAAIYKWTRNHGGSADAAALASWLPSMFDSITLVLFALASAVELLHVHELSRPEMIALVIVITGLTIVIAGVVILLARNEWMNAIVNRLCHIIKRFHNTFDDRKLMATVERAERTWTTMKSGGWIRPSIFSLLILVFDVLCLRYAFIAAGVPVHFTVLIAGYGVPILLGRASFLPGGIAVTEVAMAAIYGGLGVTPSAAVVAVLTYRLISFWLPALVGIPIAIALQSRKRQPSRT